MDFDFPLSERTLIYFSRPTLLVIPYSLGGIIYTFNLELTTK